MKEVHSLVIGLENPLINLKSELVEMKSAFQDPEKEITSLTEALKDELLEKANQNILIVVDKFLKSLSRQVKEIYLVLEQNRNHLGTDTSKESLRSLLPTNFLLSTKKHVSVKILKHAILKVLHLSRKWHLASTLMNHEYKDLLNSVKDNILNLLSLLFTKALEIDIFNQNNSSIVEHIFNCFYILESQQVFSNILKEKFTVPAFVKIIESKLDEKNLSQILYSFLNFYLSKTQYISKLLIRHDILNCVFIDTVEAVVVEKHKLNINGDWKQFKETYLAVSNFCDTLNHLMAGKLKANILTHWNLLVYQKLLEEYSIKYLSNVAFTSIDGKQFNTELVDKTFSLFEKCYTVFYIESISREIFEDIAIVALKSILFLLNYV